MLAQVYKMTSNFYQAANGGAAGLPGIMTVISVWGALLIFCLYHASLLFRARMKLTQLQCKSQINKNLSSQVTLDGHCFPRKVAYWCPPTFDKVSQPCACVHACTQAPRGF